jgi:N-acetyl-anhydromuramyl-L-alanine amidase AmpD
MIDSSLINYIKKYSNSRVMNTIVIHCSATKEDKDYSVADIKKWHLQRGFNDVGYHFIIKLDGTIEIGRSLDKVGAHVAGNNTGSIGICYIGGLDSLGRAKDTRTNNQKEALKTLVDTITACIPTIKEIKGHRDYSKDLNKNGKIESFEYIKTCPCFEVKDEFKI